MTYIKYTAGALAMVAIVDVFGFMAWIASGQVPVDDAYIGTITAHAVRFVVGL